MKDAHLTLRLPANLARALARWARAHRVPKSHAAREAVARFLEPESWPYTTRALTARELKERWRAIPRLTDTGAAEFARELATARKELAPLRPSWE